MNGIRVSDINSKVIIKGFFRTTCEVIYKTPDGTELNLSEPARKTYVNYSDAKYQLRTFDDLNKNLHELSIYLSRLVDQHDSTNAINYDLNHPIWKAFQKLLEKRGEFAQAVSELKELLDPVIDINTGRVVQEDAIKVSYTSGGMKMV